MLSYPDILVSNNINAFGIIKALEIQGHRCVQTLNDLYTLTDPQLSLSGNNTNNDSLGSEWFVTSEKARYELVDWSKRKTADGWKKVVGDTYTKSELDKKFSDLQNNMNWKPSVANFAAIAILYPTPKEGWTVSTADDNNIYRYDEASNKWINIFQNQTALASATNNGLLSKELWVKLNELTQYVHPATHPATMITEDATHRFITDAERTKWNSMGSGLLPSSIPATMITEDATHRFITDTERTKWNSMGSGLLPSSFPATMITEDATHRFITDIEKNKWNGLVSFPGYKGTGGNYGSDTKAARYDHIHEYLPAIKTYNVKDKIYDGNNSIFTGLKIIGKNLSFISQRGNNSNFDCLLMNTWETIQSGPGNYLLLSKNTNNEILHGTIDYFDGAKWNAPKKLAYFEDTLSNHIDFGVTWDSVFNNNTAQSLTEKYTKFGDYNNLKFLGGHINNSLIGGDKLFFGFDIRNIADKHTQLAIDTESGEVLTRAKSNIWGKLLRQEENSPVRIKNSYISDKSYGYSTILQQFGATNICNLEFIDNNEQKEQKAIFFPGYLKAATIAYFPSTKPKDSYFVVDETKQSQASKLLIGIGLNFDDEIWFKTAVNSLRIFRNDYGHTLVDTCNFRQLFVDEVLNNKDGQAGNIDVVSKIQEKIGNNFVDKTKIQNIPVISGTFTDNTEILSSAFSGNSDNKIYRTSSSSLYSYIKNKLISESFNKHSRTISLDGVVTGSSSGEGNITIPTTIPNGKITNQMLKNSSTKILGKSVELGSEFSIDDFNKATNGFDIKDLNLLQKENGLVRKFYNLYVGKSNTNQTIIVNGGPIKSVVNTSLVIKFDNALVTSDTPYHIKFIIYINTNGLKLEFDSTHSIITSVNSVDTSINSGELFLFDFYSVPNPDGSRTGYVL